MNVIENIKSIRLEKGIKQEALAFALNFDVANYSRIENGKQELKVNQLEKIAQELQVNVIDLFTYPKVFVDRESIESRERISVCFDVPADRRDVLLALIKE